VHGSIGGGEADAPGVASLLAGGTVAFATGGIVAACEATAAFDGVAVGVPPDEAQPPIRKPRAITDGPTIRCMSFPL
jgi:hypothetical protein